MIRICLLLFLCLIRIREASLKENGVVVTKEEGEKEDVVWSVNLPMGFSWWKLDMEAKHLVSEIHIICGNNSDTSHEFLRNLTISVASEEGDEKVCITVEDSLESEKKQKFTCVNHPRYARYVFIKRPDGMPLAEIKVFAKKLEKEGIKSLLVKVPTSESSNIITESFIDLKDLTSEQGGTWNNHDSRLAIDGDFNTYSVACMKCDHGLSGGPGWWQVDLGRERAVTGISIFTSTDHYNALYFADLYIFVGSTRSTDSRDSRICYEFSNNDSYPPGQRFDFRCKNAPLIGRFLTIRRKINAKFRPDALSLAEVKILENSNHPELSFETKIFDNTLLTLEKTSASQATVQRPIKAIQSGTRENHNAELALDGKPDTWSMADTNEELKYNGLTAWWQADFGSFRTLTNVSITSSIDENNAVYLKDISVDVSNSSAADTTNNFIQCNSFREDIGAGETINLNCHEELFGRYVIIRRVNNTEFSPAVLAMAEVRLSYN